MREFWPSLILAFPMAMYVGAVVLGSVPPSDAAFSGTFLGVLVLAVGSTLPVGSVRLGAAAALLVFAFALGITLFLSPPVGAELLAGTLLALPAVLLSYAVRPGPFGWRLLALAGAVTEGLGLLAADLALTSSGNVVTGGAFVLEFVFLNVTQLGGLAGLLTSTGGALPLRDIFDPVYIALAAIAASGILIPTLRPQSAWDESLPSAGYRSTAPERGADPVRIDPAVEVALEGRSYPDPPTSGTPPGLSPLLLGSIAAVVVVASAFLDPAITLGLLVIGTVTGLAATMLLMRRPLVGQHGRGAVSPPRSSIEDEGWVGWRD